MSVNNNGNRRLPMFEGELTADVRMSITLLIRDVHPSPSAVLLRRLYAQAASAGERTVRPPPLLRRQRTSTFRAPLQFARRSRRVP